MSESPVTTPTPKNAHQDAKKARRNEIAGLYAKIRQNTATEQHKQRYFELTGRLATNVPVETPQQRERRLQKLRQYQLKRQEKLKQEKTASTPKKECSSLNHPNEKAITNASQISDMSYEQVEVHPGALPFIEKPKPAKAQATNITSTDEKKQRSNELSKLIQRIQSGRATDQDKQRYMEMTGKSEPTIRPYKRKSSKSTSTASPSAATQAFSPSQAPTPKEPKLKRKRLDSVHPEEKRQRAKEVSTLIVRIKSNRASEQDKQRYMELTGKSEPTIRSYKTKSSKSTTSADCPSSVTQPDPSIQSSSSPLPEPKLKRKKLDTNPEEKRQRAKEVSLLINRIKNNRATDQDKQRYMELTGKSEPTIRSYNTKNKAPSEPKAPSQTASSATEPKLGRKKIDCDPEQKRERQKELNRLIQRIKQDRATEWDKQRYMELTGKSEPTIRTYSKHRKREDGSMDKSPGAVLSSNNYNSDSRTVEMEGGPRSSRDAPPTAPKYKAEILEDGTCVFHKNHTSSEPGYLPEPEDPEKEFVRLTQVIKYGVATEDEKEKYHQMVMSRTTNQISKDNSFDGGTAATAQECEKQLQQEESTRTMTSHHKPISDEEEDQDEDQEDDRMIPEDYIFTC